MPPTHNFERKMQISSEGFVPAVAEGKWTVAAAVAVATASGKVAGAAAAADAEPAAANSSSAAAGCSIRCWAFRWAAETALRPEL